MSTIGPAKKQDSYTVEQVAKDILPKLSRGSYRLDVGESNDIKVSSVTSRWVQKEEVYGD